MKIEIETPLKKVIIPEAEIKRFIDLQSGLPLSKVRIIYSGSAFKELAQAFVEETSLSFKCSILKTEVVVSGISIREEGKIEYTFKEVESSMKCGYKIMSFDHKFANEKAILAPEDIVKLHDDQIEILRRLPFIRLILREDIPKGYLLPFPRYK